MKDRKQRDNPEEDGPMDIRPTAKKEKASAALGREIQAKIGQQLRAYYDALVEPTPEKFSELLRQLNKPDNKEKSE